MKVYGSRIGMTVPGLVASRASLNVAIASLLAFCGRATIIVTWKSTILFATAVPAGKALASDVGEESP